jgi:hypothetical protein
VKDCTTQSFTIPNVMALTRVVVDITKTAFTATVSSSASITRMIANPSTGYLGFTGSTGTTGHTGHVVTAVEALSCP